MRVERVVLLRIHDFSLFINYTTNIRLMLIFRLLVLSYILYMKKMRVGCLLYSISFNLNFIFIYFSIRIPLVKQVI